MHVPLISAVHTSNTVGLPGPHCVGGSHIGDVPPLLPLLLPVPLLPPLALVSTPTTLPPHAAARRRRKPAPTRLRPCPMHTSVLQTTVRSTAGVVGCRAMDKVCKSARDACKDIPDG